MSSLLALTLHRPVYAAEIHATRLEISTCFTQSQFSGYIDVLYRSLWGIFGAKRAVINCVDVCVHDMPVRLLHR